MRKILIFCLLILPLAGCSGVDSSKSSSVLSNTSVTKIPTYDKKLSEPSTIDLGPGISFLSFPDSLSPLPQVSQEGKREDFYLIFGDGEPFRKQVLEFQEWIEGQGFQLLRKRNVRKKLPQKVILEFQKGSETFQFEIDQ